MLIAQTGREAVLRLHRFRAGCCGIALADFPDRQRGVFSDDGLTLAVDVRLDNPKEMADFCGIRRSDASDATLFFEVYKRIGRSVVDLAVGDFAFAAFDERGEQLVLGRDPTGQRPLHYWMNANTIAFASLPSGLLSLPPVGRSPDLESLAEFVGDLPRRGRRSFYSDVKRVLPGETIQILRGRWHAEPYFTLPDGEIRYPTDSDYEEALREHLDRAVASRVEGGGGVIASHLSGGLDSASVTATAAIHAGADRKIIAFTSAPRIDFEGSAPQGRVADESALAAIVARSFPNMHHQVVRSRSLSMLELLERDSSHFEEPIGHLCNQVWWEEILQRAQEEGARVLLTGEAGNLAFSAGSVNLLPDLVRLRTLPHLFREFMKLNRSGVSLPGRLVATFGPMVPMGMWKAINRGHTDQAGQQSFLRPHCRADLARRSSQQRGGRPARNDRLARWNSLIPADPGCFRKRSFLRWGIEELDPTADRRLLAFCFAVPPEQLIRAGVTRSLVRRAMRDRLPAEVLWGPRGYQSADWYEYYDPELAARRVACARDSKVVDFGLMSEAAASWPKQDFNESQAISHYRLGFLRALSAAAFELGR
jgi:asparagine synthase (glutamine-hydrolysing)